MSLRDDLLPIVDNCRKITQDLGQRTTTLTIRTRTWTSGRIGKTSEAPDPDFVDSDLNFPGRYHISSLSLRAVNEIVNGSGGRFNPGAYVKLWVTPQFAGGGYTKAELVPDGSDGVEIIYVLVGGLDGNYELVSTDFGRPYRYELILRAKNDSPPP